MFPLLPQEQDSNLLIPNKLKKFEDRIIVPGCSWGFLLFIIMFFPIIFPLIFVYSHIIHTGEALCLLYRGRYIGTVIKTGCYFLNPFYTVERRSLKQLTHSGNILKVNDKGGNPIEIKAVFVYRIVNVVASCYNIDHINDFIIIQSECALRNLAAKFKYNSSDINEKTLVNGGKFLKEMLIRELNERLSVAGIIVDDANITHLSYAKEVLGIMLKKQYASTTVQAKEKLVNAFSSVVKDSIDKLEKQFTIPKQIKNNIASNLLVSLFSENPSIACLHLNSEQETNVNII